MRIKITKETIDLYPESGREEQDLHQIYASADTHSIDRDSSGVPVVLRLWRERRQILSDDFSDQRLSIWTGPGNCLFVPYDHRWRGVIRNNSTGYLCANGRRHGSEIIARYRGDFGKPVTPNMIRDGWTYGWGAEMTGVVQEPGLWIQFRPGDTPVKVT